MAYEGPGTYRHYKGGLYSALGLGQHESTGALLVVYVNHSEAHTLERAERGVSFVLRPLHPEDGPDAWNEDVDGRPRFERVSWTA